MIITVTLNAAIDKSLAVPNFKLGRRHRTVDQRTMAGGKGVNIARTLKALGQVPHLRQYAVTSLAGHDVAIDADPRLFGHRYDVLLAAAMKRQHALTGFKPRVLPKLEFKEGIPPECRTFVVMPSMLVSEENVRELLDHLEIVGSATTQGIVTRSQLNLPSARRARINQKPRHN